MSVAVTVERNVAMTMRDGTVLSADVYRPDDSGSRPVLLQRTPYDKSLTGVIGLVADPLRFASNGYAVVVKSATD